MFFPTYGLTEKWICTLLTHRWCIPAQTCFCMSDDKKINSIRTSLWPFFTCHLGTTSTQSCSYARGDLRQGNCCCRCYREAICHHGDLGPNASGSALIATQWWPAHQTLSGSPQNRVCTNCLLLDIFHYLLHPCVSQPSTWCKGKMGKQSSCPHSTTAQYEEITQS